MSHLTLTEQQALSASTLHRKTPFLIQGVSQSQFSVARYSGGCIYNGVHYVYLPETDELIRQDVVKWLKKYRREKEREP